MVLAEATETETAHAAAVDHVALRQSSRQGVIYGALSYGCWGLIPLYFKAVATVPPVEVLGQRVVWSFAFLAVAVFVVRRWDALAKALGNRQVLLALAASTLLLAVNWFTYIYAVSANRVVEASLGYFLNPLVNVVIGVTLLKEKLRTWQLASVMLAIAGVAIFGHPPIAITLGVDVRLLWLVAQDRGRGRLGGAVRRDDAAVAGGGGVSWLSGGRGPLVVRRERSADVPAVGRQRNRHGRPAIAVCRRRAAIALRHAGLLAVPGPLDSVSAGRIRFWRSHDAHQMGRHVADLDGGGHLLD